MTVRAGDPWSTLVTMVLGLTMVLLAVVDILVLRLPDVVTLPLSAAGLLLGPLAAAPWSARVLGAMLGFVSLYAVGAAFRRWQGRSGLGLGDAKLFAAVGAWVGWDQLPQVLLLACAAGFAWAGVRCVKAGMASLSQPIPFGFGLCLAGFVVWLTQRP